MNKYRTFRIPLKNEGGFNHLYRIEDVGLDQSDFYSFKYIDIAGNCAPMVEDLPDDARANIDKVFLTQYIPDEEGIEYSYRVEMTSVSDIESDIIVKLISLPGVEEIDTTLFHLSHILKQTLSRGKPIDSIIDAIKNCK